MTAISHIKTVLSQRFQRSSLQRRMMLQEVHVEAIDRLVRESSSTGRIVSGLESLTKYLLQHELAMHLTIPPQFVATSLQNRSGSLSNPGLAHLLGEKIIGHGFSFAKARDCVAVEAPPPTDPQYAVAVAKNERLTALSNGLCPPLQELKYLSIGGSHTNVFLRALCARAPSTVKSLVDADGKLDYDRLTSGQPELKQACESGLRWLVVQAKVATACPQAIDFIQRALNTYVREAATETECIHNGCSQQTA